jgi:hypothetical protein
MAEKQQARSLDFEIARQISPSYIISSLSLTGRPARRVQGA